MTEPSPGLALNHAQVAEALLQRKPVLRSKLVAACDIDPSRAHEALAEVLRFLSLVASHGGGLTPSVRVDHAWHEFVLCTRLYASWCTETLGRFIHHDPGGSDALNRERFARTLTLYADAFGPPPQPWWGHKLPTLPDADCGPCEGAPSPPTSESSP